MNAVWNSYGQLCGCPEIFKKSCKFFCRELDIRVPQGVYPAPFLLYSKAFACGGHIVPHAPRIDQRSVWTREDKWAWCFFLAA